MAGSESDAAVRRGKDGVDRLVALANDRIAIDLRALAALRIALGSLLLADLLLRARNFEVFYTDRGVYPLAYLDEPLSEPYSIHAYSGSFEFQAFLFVVAGLFALSLLLGYRTRTATVVSWLLLLSLQHRNPLVLNSGDTLLRVLVFWGTFLPLGARWSVDSRGIDWSHDGDGGAGGVAGETVASLATVAILVQVVLVYAVNAVHKLKSEEWVYGNAAGTIMQLEQFTVFLGPYLAEFTPLLWVVTRVWFVLIVASPLLLLLTGWPRILLTTAIAGMHLGMALTMQIGLFPLVSIASLLVFYPPFVWNRIERKAANAGIAERSGRLLDRLYALDPLPRRPDRSGSLLPVEWPSPGRVVATLLVLVLLPSVVISGIASTGYGDTPDLSATLLDHVEMDQGWQMFAPNPLDTTRWYVAVGNTTDGERVDPFRGGSASLEKPPNPADSVVTARWRKYLGFVQHHTPLNHKHYFASYLCEQWSRGHDGRLANVSVYAFQQDVGPDGPVTPVERDPLVEDYDCSGDLIQA